MPRKVTTPEKTLHLRAKRPTAGMITRVLAGLQQLRRKLLGYHRVPGGMLDGCARDSRKQQVDKWMSVE